MTEKIAFFQKICVLNNLLGSQRIDLITCTNIAMIRCGAKQKDTQCLSKWLIGERMGQNFFFGTLASILKILVLDFLDPKEKIKYLAQYLSKNLVYPYNLIHDFCDVR